MMLLLDTNVWADYYTPKREAHKSAYDLIDYACSHEIELLYAVNSTRDVFYRVCSEAKKDCREANGGHLTDSDALAARSLAWGCVEHMTGIATAVGCDASDVWSACKIRSIHGDYEDNLIIAAARRSGVDFLVTGDRQLTAHSPLAALSAEDMLKYLQIDEG